MIDEAFVQEVFCRWLTTNGWNVVPGYMNRGADITAFGDSGETLIVECKGNTGKKSGIDADIAYGQILRRMDAGRAYMELTDNPSIRFAIVVPKTDRFIYAALRVSRRVRKLLGISIYAVSEDGSVSDISGRDTLAPT